MRRKISSSTAWLLSLAALTFALRLTAADAAYEGAKWAPLDTKPILEAAANINLTNYPDCDAATVESRMVRVYRADGTGEAQDETFTKVLTEKGKRNSRTIALGFMLPYNTVQVVKLEVIRPDGEVLPVDLEANSKESIDDSQMGMNIYDPNVRVLRVNVPRLEPGDILHSITRTTTLRSIIPGEFAEWNLFEGGGYIRHASYDVYAPKDKPLNRIFLRDEVPGTVKYSSKPGEGDGILHQWEVTNVPQMFNEPAMPPYEMVLQRLIVSTTPDWPAVSKWYWEVSKPHLDATSPEMQVAVDRLVAGAKTDLDKVKNIFYDVSKSIRYMGLTPEKDRPGFEPHDVKLTFEKKYGVCRDKAALLVAMLRAAGLKAYPVLINVGTKKDPEIAEPFFNHAIVAVELKDRDYTLMDPTDENTKDLLPASECDQSYLVCRPEGEDIRVSPIRPPEENMMKVKTVATLNAQGLLEAKSELDFEGINDNSYREAFARMKPDDKRRFFERALKRTMPGAMLKSLKLTPEDMLDTSVTVRAELEYTADGMTAAGNGKAIVSLPWIGKGMGIVQFILGGAGLEKRKYPMRTYVACGLQEDMTIKLGEGFTGSVSMPSFSPTSDACIDYTQRVEHKDQALKASRELKLKVVEFSPEQYLQLRRTLESLEYDERKAPVMAVADNIVAVATPRPAGVDAAVESNARVLDSTKSFHVQDAHTGVYRAKYSKQILTYSGKKREAEFKIEFNPACQEAKLISAVVTSKTGQRQEIAKDEINIMDAGWNSSAKRYTGGKVLVANLPGVDIGSTIEVEFEITSHDRPFISAFEPFQVGDALDKKSFQLTVAPGIKVQRLITGKAGAVQESTSENSWRWSAESVRALPAEAQTPPDWIFLPGVAYFVGDLGPAVKDLQATFLARAGKGSKAATLARELTEKSATKAESIRAIRDFVAKNIRAAGPSFTDLPLKELSDADTTLADGYGHAADRAILLHAMLSAAGFEPEFVMASGLPPINTISNLLAAFPMPYAFANPLVRVRTGGEEFYLNDTDQYSRLGSTFSDGRLAVALSNLQLEVVHAAKDCEDKTETTYAMIPSENGKTKIEVTRRYFGSMYNGKNRYFSELPPEERKRYFQEVVANLAQGARPQSDLVTQFDVYPGIERFSVEVDKYTVVDGRYFYFDMPFTPSLFPIGSDHRTLPLFVSRRGQSTVRTEVDLPPLYPKVDISPKAGELRGPAGSGVARITSSAEAGKLVVSYDLETSPAIVDPSEYPEMLRLESILGNRAARVFLLEGGPETANPR
jgi:transglutaminase-like putative cysteine protease